MAGDLYRKYGRRLNSGYIVMGEPQYQAGRADVGLAKVSDSSRSDTGYGYPVVVAVEVGQVRADKPLNGLRNKTLREIWLYSGGEYYYVAKRGPDWHRVEEYFEAEPKKLWSMMASIDSGQRQDADAPGVRKK